MRFYFTFLLMWVCASVYGQYIPNSSQAYQFYSSYNPAFAGIENYGDLKLGYRYQWTTFGSNAPKFVTLQYNCRLNHPFDASLNSLRPSNPHPVVPKYKRIIHGFALNFFNEDVGVINRWGGGVSYSLHYPLTKAIRVATGLSAMLDNTKVNVSEVYLGNNPDPDPFYDQLLNNGVNQLDLQVRAGVVLYSPGFYIGFCYLPVWNKTLERSAAEFEEKFYRGTFQGGFSIPVNASFQIRPSVAGVWQTDNKVHLDYNVKTYFRERIWLGVTYRDIESGVGLIGMSLNKLLVVTYSYEVPINSLKQSGNGSHELVLAMRLNNSNALNQFIW